jgi:putative endonuclease
MFTREELKTFRHCERSEAIPGSAYNIPMRGPFFVYILTNKYHTVYYTGVTNNLDRRLLEHKSKSTTGFTARYNATKLVYYEVIDDINSAIGREKQIKGGSRQRKIELIDEFNPKWVDLSIAAEEK